MTAYGTGRGDYARRRAERVPGWNRRRAIPHQIASMTRNGHAPLMNPSEIGSGAVINPRSEAGELVRNCGAMPELQRVRAEHGPAILAFELENRAYFAASITDRGDDYFEHFAERYEELLARQEAGVDIYHVLVETDGAVIGRFNLMDIGDGAAELGYRVGQRVVGRGVATAAVEELCQLAASQMGLRTLRAKTTRENLASQRVLAKAGFLPAGPADVAGRPGTWYRRGLSTSPASVE